MIRAAAKYCIRQAIWLLPAWLRRYIYSVIQLGLNDPVTRERVEHLIGVSVSATNAGDFEKAERSLQEAATLHPSDPRIAPHLGRVRFLRSRSADVAAQNQTRNMLAAIDSMNREIQSAQIY